MNIDFNQELIDTQEVDDGLSLGDLLQIVRANWYWFFLSIIMCVGLAVVYLQWAPKQYSRTASVLIKDDKSGSGAMSEASAFADLGMFNMKSSVDNEVLIFQSKQLMGNVVERLRLDVGYTERKGLRTVELYTQSPVSVTFPDAEPAQSLTLVATPLDKNRISLSGFEADSVEVLEAITVNLNDTVQTPVGRVVVAPTLYYTDIYYGKEVTVSKKDRDAVTLYFNTALEVSLASKMATIINLSLQDVSIVRAEDVINTLIAIYNEDAINDKNRIMVSTSDFINDRLIIIEKDLGDVDSNIEVFKRENQLTDIVSETGMYLKESSEYNKEGLGLENQLALAKYIYDYLKDSSKSSELIPSNTGISDANVESQIGEYNNLLLKRDRLVGNSSNKNPVVMDLNNSILAMKQTIMRSVDNMVVSLNIQIESIRSREVQTKRRISAVPGQQKLVLSIERQQKIKEELYLYLLNKREENALSQSITESNARIIDPATGGKAPIAPKSTMVLLIALVMGCAIPAGIIWLLFTTDTKVRTRKDLEQGLSVPFLGEIPERKGKDKSEIVVRDSGRDAVSEAFRIVRTNMDFMRVKATDLKVVMFTSSNSGAGKTFVSMNLAMSFALTHKKVVLVDLDIRKGTLSSRVRSSNVGVTNYLSGRATLDEIIQQGELDTYLDNISAGPVPPNPAELLLSERLEELVGELKQCYDYVILDNVPATMVADAAIVNRVADLTIYVVRAGVFDRRQLPDLERLYRQEKFRNMSVILNGISYKGKGYGYGYGYGYGNENDKKKKKK